MLSQALFSGGRGCGGVCGGGAGSVTTWHLSQRGSSLENTWSPFTEISEGTESMSFLEAEVGVQS